MIESLDFSNTNLRIKLLGSLSEASIYSLLLSIDESTSKFDIETKVTLSSSKNDYCFIVVHTQKINPIKKYTEQERLFLYNLLTSLPTTGKYLELLEAIVISLGNKKLNNMFYTYCMFKLVFCDYISKLKPEDLTDDGYYTLPIYQEGVNDKYCVADLLEDIVKDKSDILLDPELLGNYTRISSRQDTGAKRVDNDSWLPLLGITRNKNRANMSLKYLCNVEVEVPENTVGVEPGKRKLKSMRNVCIIKDSCLWTPRIGVKVKSPELLKKFNELGIVVCELAYTNDVLIDLTKLPLVNTNYMTSTYLGLLDIVDKMVVLKQRRLFAIAKRQYLENPGTPLNVYKKESKVEIPEDIKFLHELGIYENTYIPPKQKTVISTEEYKIYGLEISYSDKVSLEPYNYVFNRYFKNPESVGKDKIAKLLHYDKLYNPDEDFEKETEDLMNEFKKEVFRIIVRKFNIGDSDLYTNKGNRVLVRLKELIIRL